jgi:hypothetical protein
MGIRKFKETERIAGKTVEIANEGIPSFPYNGFKVCSVKGYAAVTGISPNSVNDRYVPRSAGYCLHHL